MIPLFGDSLAGGKRFVLEGRMITLALQLLRLETNVVLDFGCWAKDERSALRWLTQREGGSFQLVYMPIERRAQLERIGGRWIRTPHETFAMTAADLDRWREVFEVPDAAELGDQAVQDPPAGWSSWLDWAKDHWPSLSTGEGEAG
jgi:predicted kinase